MWKDVLPSTFLELKGLNMKFKCRSSVIALMFKHKKATTKPLRKTRKSSEISVDFVHTKIPLKEPSTCEHKSNNIPMDHIRVKRLNIVMLNVKRQRHYRERALKVLTM